MKPINADEKGCNPISSDCVIWQGPDIECIKLCKGDSVSTVVAKLATELCNLIDQFDIDAYDLDCLNLGDCGPKNFQDLIQLLIERICALEGIEPPTPEEGISGCPDCVVNIAECFYYQNPQGDTETTMQLIDYVTAIGNSVCTLIGQINTINQILENHEGRIEALENAPDPEVVLPLVTPVCVLPAQPTDMNVVLAALETQFCELIGATGSAIDLYGAIAQQCAGLNDATQLAGSGNMSGITGWQSTVSNLAAAISNIWLTICDIRSAVQNIQVNCCPNNCDDIDVTMTASLPDPNTLKVNFTGSIPFGFTSCNPAGQSLRVQDESGGEIIVTVDVVANLNNLAGITFDLTGSPLNTTENLTLTIDSFCLKNTEGTQCQSVLQYILGNTVNCPVLQLTPTDTTINYQFGWAGGAASFDVQLWDVTQTVMIASQVTAVGGPQVVSGDFTSLVAGTQYYVRVVVTVNENVTTCPYTPVTTVPAACLPATDLTSQIDIP